MGISSPFEFCGYIGVDLALADSEHFHATGQGDVMSCRIAERHSLRCSLPGSLTQS